MTAGAPADAAATDGLRRLWLDATGVLIALLAIAGFLTAYHAWWRRPRASDDQGLYQAAYGDATFTHALGPARLVRGVDEEADGPRFVEWRGTLFVPHDGALILRPDVTGEGAADLRLDDNPPVFVESGLPPRGAEPRLFVGVGAHRLSIRWRLPAGHGALRLLWLPPGRRGGDTEEYVPPSALGPRDASAYRSAAAVAGHPSSFVPVGMVASGILWVLLGLGLWLGRARVARYVARLRDDASARRDLYLLLGVTVVAWAVRLWGLSRQGQTWDEDVYWSAGRNYLVNLVSLDFRPRSWLANLEHPPWTKYLAGYMALFWDGYGPARALSALCGALTCGVVYLAGRDLYSRRVGLLAAALATFSPPLIAHSKVVGHESPTTLFFTLAVWRFLRAVRSDEGAGGYVEAGLWAGLTLGTRFSSGLVFVLLGGVTAAYAWRRRTPRLLARAALTPGTALAFVVATWPRMWSSPLAHLAESWAKLSHPHDAELFLGQLVGATGRASVPWTYYPVYFSATVPALVLAALALFAWRVAARRGESEWLTLAWIVVPFGVAFSPVQQDGVRYLLPAFPAVAIAAAAGVEQLVSVRPARERYTMAGIGAALAVYAAIACARIHPYYLDYYNELWGGPARAEKERLFEVGWWGEGIAEATSWINAHAPAGARVLVRLVPSHLTWLRHDLVRVDEPGAAEYVMWNQLAQGEPRLPGFAPAYTVTAAGAPLVEIYQRAPAAAPDTPSARGSM